jgi:hypothetical protein
MNGLSVMAIVGAGLFGLMMLMNTKGSIQGRVVTTFLYFLSFFVFGATGIGLLVICLGQTSEVRGDWWVRLAFLVPASIFCGGCLWKLRPWMR